MERPTGVSSSKSSVRSTSWPKWRAHARLLSMEAARLRVPSSLICSPTVNARKGLDNSGLNPKTQMLRRAINRRAGCILHRAQTWHSRPQGCGKERSHIRPMNTTICVDRARRNRRAPSPQTDASPMEPGPKTHRRRHPRATTGDVAQRYRQGFDGIDCACVCRSSICHDA